MLIFLLYAVMALFSPSGAVTPAPHLGAAGFGTRGAESNPSSLACFPAAASPLPLLAPFLFGTDSAVSLVLLPSSVAADRGEPQGV